MARIIRHLASQPDDLEAAEIANAMRVLLFKWLTSPVAFDESIREAVQSFGSAGAFESRWGLQGEYRAAIQSAQEMILEQSPLRDELLATVRKLRADGRTFKIFCHRKAREPFDSLFVPPADERLSESLFLHSPRDYANTGPFETLIKIGPLRSTGWGAIPDAVASAPRFQNLVQLVWTGCGDEPGFGYDPVESPPLNGNTIAAPGHDVLPNQIAWKRRITRSGSDPHRESYYSIENDEFVAFPEPNEPGLKRRATLVEILDGDGILYPRKAGVLSFAPDAGDKEAVEVRFPGETLREGMFVIQAQLAEAGFGEAHASESGYWQIWKQRLREELRTSPAAFCLILRNKGLDLQSLSSCVENWAEPPHAVIHAPQKMRHFRILIEALAIDPAITQPTRENPAPWWQRAWNEIRISRGEAIQTGLQEHEIVEKKAVEFLRSIIPELRKGAAARDGFRIQVPSGADVRGAFTFFKALRIEEGFLAPEGEMKVVRDLNTVEQWRVA